MALFVPGSMMFVLAAGLFLGTPGIASASVAPTACASGDATCDVDGDGIPDGVEVAVCGSATCATGREDSDADGVPDAVEVEVSGTLTGVDPASDIDKDGIPDFAELAICSTELCSTGREDTDGDGIPDWAEVVICGTVTCASGTEDLDGNGVQDWKQLVSCVQLGHGDPGPSWFPSSVRHGLARIEVGYAQGGIGRALAVTGTELGYWPLVAVAMIGVGVGLRVRSRRQFRNHGRGLVTA